jgi:hypothetical protein
MSAVPANPTPDYSSLRAFLAGVKSASVEHPPSADSTIPADGGKAPHIGARFEENETDTKTKPPKYNPDHAAPNTFDGRGNHPVPNSNLEQTDADAEDSQTKAVKTVHDENMKMGSLDLTKDTDLDKALAALDKAAAAFPGLLARSGIRTHVHAAVSLLAPNLSEADRAKWAAEQQAVANTVEEYRKLGADRGRTVASYLRGHDDTIAFLKRAEADGSLAQMLAAQPPPDGGGGGDGAVPPDAGAAGAVPPGAGAMPPVTAAPAAGAGPAPPDGGGGEEITPEDLTAAFAEAHITPEEFVQILQELKGQLPGAEMPEEEKDKAAAAIRDGEKLAADAKRHLRSGQFQFKPAADGTVSRRHRDVVRAYLNEIRAAGA